MEKVIYRRVRPATKERTKERKRVNWARWYPEEKDKNPGRMLERTRRNRQRVKVEVLTHYGNGKLACVRCGFQDMRALSIDHMNGGGLAHLREIGKKSGVNFYYWLRKQGYPLGYQTFCFNCQNIKKAENKEYFDPSNYKPAQPILPVLAQTARGGARTNA